MLQSHQPCARQSALPHEATILLTFCFIVSAPVWAQLGVVTGNGVATPAKPLPPGMKPPVVSYVDIAKQAGLTTLNISGAEQNKQYIVETTGMCCDSRLR